MFSFFPLQPRNTRFSEGDSVGKNKSCFPRLGSWQEEKEILQPSRLPCRSSMFPRPHTSSQDIVKQRITSPHHCTLVPFQKSRVHHVIRLQENRTRPHYLQVHKNSSLQFWFHSLKPAMKPSSAWEEWFLSSPFSFLTDLFLVLLQTHHIYRQLLLWTHWVYETPSVARAPVDEAKKKPSHGRWNSPSKNTVVCDHSILQGIFSTHGSNLGLLHCRQILYHLSQQESPIYLYQSINYIEETPWLLAHVLPFLQFSKGWCYNCTSLSSHHHNDKKTLAFFF